MGQFEMSFEATGTHWSVQAEGTGLTDTLQDAVRHLIEQFERTYSRFQSDSLVSKMAEAGGRYPMPMNFELLLETYREAYILTEGSVTPLIGQVLSDAGYDATYSLTAKTLTTPPDWDDIMQYEFPDLILHRPARLDFGAAGKGYLIDLVGEQLQTGGVSSYTVNAGGDLLVGVSEQVIGLEDPIDPERMIGTIRLREGSVCGSSGNRRRWPGYHHIIDPHRLHSPEQIIAVWATASSALIADMLTTCLFFSKGREFARRHSAEYLVLYNDYSFDCTSGFPADLHLKQQHYE